jgi:hypothetical protein
MAQSILHYPRHDPVEYVRRHRFAPRPVGIDRTYMELNETYL